MSPRYAGRHTGQAEAPDTGPARTGPPPARPWRKVALWVGLAACAAFTLYVLASLFGLLHDLDHPGNDGWLCSPDSSTCRP
ncbi:hypothetical protein NMG29_07335 [Streptomyces cocklensis]|uniref:Uncharacterized protein n=1 Tax=Actinacidiphila cocklensis TaxID=887465 RepID=A0A9W4DN83_9ACTN|nr:hypothetical protein [Actinacidiphila cocklensis]MDD1058040.1 hypothetical protein [Actinacidiphila cocklensis]WSX79517.1 hypothetical protein OH826_40130 [Streptomyces sp. NBC_00899]CAG6393064.1 conserved hypothetical protein [Actinacidiphila cocklensis]